MAVPEQLAGRQKSESHTAAWIGAGATIVSALIAGIIAVVLQNNDSGRPAVAGSHPPKTSSTASPSCRSAGPVSINPQTVTSNNADLIYSPESPNGPYNVTVKSYANAGLFVNLPDSLCSYTVDLYATLITRANIHLNMFGYQVGTCDTWQNLEGRGFTLGYTSLADDGGDIRSDLNWTVMPLVRSEDLSQQLTPDDQEHHWHLDVHDSRVTITFDNRMEFTPFPLTRESFDEHEDPSYIKSLLPQGCSKSGMYLRVSNAQVKFSNFKVQALNP